MYKSVQLYTLKTYKRTLKTYKTILSTYEKRTQDTEKTPIKTAFFEKKGRKRQDNGREGQFQMFQFQKLQKLRLQKLQKLQFMKIWFCSLKKNEYFCVEKRAGRDPDPTLHKQKRKHDEIH